MSERDTEGHFGGPVDQPDFFAGGEESGPFNRDDETEGHMLVQGEQPGASGNGEQTDAFADQHDEDDTEGHFRAPDKAAAHDDTAGPGFSEAF